MSLKSFNVNMPVMFKLTEYGKEYYRDKVEQRNMEWIKFAEERGVQPYIAPLWLEVDTNGYSKMPMWSFMRYFGDAMYLGGKPVIELCELVFHEKDLTDFDSDIGVEDKK